MASVAVTNDRLVKARAVIGRYGPALGEERMLELMDALCWFDNALYDEYGRFTLVNLSEIQQVALAAAAGAYAEAEGLTSG